MPVKLLKDRLKLYGVPQQGVGFFTAYYAFFRGSGLLLSDGDHGMLSVIISFFTATSILYIGCDEKHIEAAVFAPSVTGMETVCGDKSLSEWGSTLTRSLAAMPSKNASKFRIELEAIEKSERDRDLVVHRLSELFPPAPTEESAKHLQNFLEEGSAAAQRLQFGGFYILALPITYNGVDLLLSAITATLSPLTYVGMGLYENDQTTLWIFRNEPMNPATLESQRTMARTRLLRYPPILQAVVDKNSPETSQIGSGLDDSFQEVLATRVTPTDSLTSLFRLATGFHPREVLNRLGSFQPKYSNVIDKIRATSELKVQVRMIIELLYDLALSSQRLCNSARILQGSSE
jgi:hypothetical protein